MCGRAGFPAEEFLGGEGNIRREEKVFDAGGGLSVNEYGFPVSPRESGPDGGEEAIDRGGEDFV